MQKNLSNQIRELESAIKETTSTKKENSSHKLTEKEILKITKQQQDLGKIIIKDSSDMLALKLKLKKNKKIDNKITTSAPYNVKKLRKLALKEKIEKPLQLKRPLKEKELKKIKNKTSLSKLIKQKSS